MRHATSWRRRETIGPNSQLNQLPYIRAHKRTEGYSASSGHYYLVARQVRSWSSLRRRRRDSRGPPFVPWVAQHKRRPQGEVGMHTPTRMFLAANDARPVSTPDAGPSNPLLQVCKCKCKCNHMVQPRSEANDSTCQAESDSQARRSSWPTRLTPLAS